MRVLLRTTVLAVGWLACLLGLTEVSGTDGGANIGLGLLMFALLTAAAGAWGAADGARQAYERVAITWVVVALLMGLLVPVLTYLRESGAEPGSAWRVLLVDLALLGPFIAVLIIVPALLGALLGRAVSGPSVDDGRERRRRTRPTM